MKITKILTVFAVFAVSVIGVSALASRSQVESDLIRQSRKVLRTNGIGGDVRVSFKGRQCILSGQIASKDEKDLLLELVGNVDGVYGTDAGDLLVVSR